MLAYKLQFASKVILSTSGIPKGPISVAIPLTGSIVAKTKPDAVLIVAYNNPAFEHVLGGTVNSSISGPDPVTSTSVPGSGSPAFGPEVSMHTSSSFPPDLILAYSLLLFGSQAKPSISP